MTETIHKKHVHIFTDPVTFMSTYSFLYHIVSITQELTPLADRCLRRQKKNFLWHRNFSGICTTISLVTLTSRKLISNGVTGYRKLFDVTVKMGKIACIGFSLCSLSPTASVWEMPKLPSVLIFRGWNLMLKMKAY